MDKHIIATVLIWIIGFVGSAVALVSHDNVDHTHLPVIEMAAITFATIISCLFAHFQRGNAAG